MRYLYILLGVLGISFFATTQQAIAQSTIPPVPVTLSVNPTPLIQGVEGSVRFSSAQTADNVGLILGGTVKSVPEECDYADMGSYKSVVCPGGDWEVTIGVNYVGQDYTRSFTAIAEYGDQTFRQQITTSAIVDHPDINLSGQRVVGEVVTVTLGMPVQSGYYNLTLAGLTPTAQIPNCLPHPLPEEVGVFLCDFDSPEIVFNGRISSTTGSVRVDSPYGDSLLLFEAKSNPTQVTLESDPAVYSTLHRTPLAITFNVTATHSVPFTATLDVGGNWWDKEFYPAEIENGVNFDTQFCDWWGCKMTFSGTVQEGSEVIIHTFANSRPGVHIVGTLKVYLGGEIYLEEAVVLALKPQIYLPAVNR